MPSYQPKHKVRIVTAAALFDGHDASINIMRRILQDGGAEVIHLGHNRAAEEVVDAAIQEDAQGIAVSSYQGGHVEFFTYMRQLLDQKGAPHVRIYGGGGGVIVPREVKLLHERGISRIFSPEDGRQLGREGLSDVILSGCDYSTLATRPIANAELDGLDAQAAPLLARLITAVEAERSPGSLAERVFPKAEARARKAPGVGIACAGGGGKSRRSGEWMRHDIEGTAGGPG